jgi:hypothetical protein
MLHRGVGDQERHLDVEIADVLAGEHCDDPWMLPRRSRIDRANMCSRVDAARKGRVQRAGKRDVVDDAPSPLRSFGSMLRSIRAPNVRVDMYRSFRQARPSSWAARRTAAMMLT